MTEQNSSEMTEAKAEEYGLGMAAWAVILLGTWICASLATGSFAWGFAVAGPVLLVSAGLFGIERQLMRLNERLKA